MESRRSRDSQEQKETNFFGTGFSRRPVWEWPLVGASPGPGQEPLFVSPGCWCAGVRTMRKAGERWPAASSLASSGSQDKRNSYRVASRIIHTLAHHIRTWSLLCYINVWHYDMTRWNSVWWPDEIEDVFVTHPVLLRLESCVLSPVTGGQCSECQTSRISAPRCRLLSGDILVIIRVKFEYHTHAVIQGTVLSSEVWMVLMWYSPGGSD